MIAGSGGGVARAGAPVRDGDGARTGIRADVAGNAARAGARAGAPEPESAAPRPDAPVLEVRGLRREFERGGTRLVAVDGISFSIGRGECLGLVGESGCGKSTTARMVARLLDPTAGQVLLRGEDVTRARGAALRGVHRRIQMVFQEPAGSFDPRRTLGHGIAEGMRNAGMPKARALSRTRELLERCGLDPEIAGRHPHEASGGQCQRAAIARALATDPELLICDEATSALDATVQRQIIGLLAGIRRESSMAVLFICHDLALVGEVCDRVAVMRAGRIVEEGPVEAVLARPQDPYTRALIGAAL